MEEGDISFIYSTMLKGLYYGASYWRKMPQGLFFANYQAVVQALLLKPGVSVVIASLSDEPDVILAYAIFEAKCAHWAYTKPAWRKQGLARLCLGQTPSMATHITEAIEQYTRDRDIIFNPFALGASNGQ